MALYRMHSTIFEATFGETRESFMGRFAPQDHALHYWFLRTCKLQLGRALLHRSQTRTRNVTKKKKTLRKFRRTNPAPPAKPSRLRESWAPSLGRECSLYRDSTSTAKLSIGSGKRCST